MSTTTFLSRPHQVEELVSDLDYVGILGSVTVEILLEFLIKGLRSDKVLLQTLLALLLVIRSTGSPKQFQRDAPDLVTLNERYYIVVRRRLLFFRATKLDQIVIRQHSR